MDLVQIAIGVALAGGAYFSYLVATKGLPAALAWVRAKWNAGKVELAAIEATANSALSKAKALEEGTVAGLTADMAKLKAANPQLFPPAPAPAAQPAQQ